MNCHVKGFSAGFFVASVLWGGAAAVFFSGLLDPLLAPPPPVGALDKEVAEHTEETPNMRRRRRRRRRGGMRRRSGATPTGFATTGDDLRDGEAREIAAGAGGGEEQLTSSQIESVLDSAFGRIRRCLVLIPGDAEVRGRVTFGLRIAGSGRVEAVNLSGPRAVTTGEPGSCLRQSARAMRFPTFDGPPMVARYPLTLE